jgi:hypothetical protein
MFGVEFAAGVVPADGTVRKLAWRICSAKEVLVSCVSEPLDLANANDGSPIGTLFHVAETRTVDTYYRQVSGCAFVEEE